MSRLRKGIDAPAKVDRLGREKFAQHVASMIRQWEGRESLIVGIFGPWGSGKTTVKNQVIEKLANMPEPPLIVAFNPWEWNGSEQVRQAFFEQLSAELKISGTSKASAAADRLALYGTLLTLGSSLTASLKTLAPFLVPGAGPFFGALGEAFGKSSDVVRGVRMPETQKSLGQVKQELANAIAEIERTIVVIVDDVDRLATGEIAQVFALLKVNADFPRVVYVVLCDPEVVAEALDQTVSGGGAGYLEKIVQVGFHLPHVSERQLEHMLTDDVVSTLREADLTYAFEWRRWENVCADGLMQYYTTLRDVNRYVASLEFTLGLIRGDGDVDIDVVDFLLLEALRMFERPLYELLPPAKEVLTGRARFGSTDESTAFVNDILSRAQQRDAAETVLAELFGLFRSANKYRGNTGPRQWGVNDYDTFDRYFHFSIPLHEYSGAQLREAVSSRGSREFLEHLRAARDAGRLGTLLKEIESHQELPSDVPAYLTAIVDFADELDLEVPGSRYSALSSFATLLWDGLESVPISDRPAVIRNVVSRARGVRLLAQFVRFDRDRADVDALTSQDVRNEVMTAVAQRIEALANTDGLRDHPHSAYLLNWWLESPGRQRAVEYIRNALGDDDGAINVLQAFSARTAVNVGRVRLRHGRVKADIRELIEVVGLQTAASAIDRLTQRPRPGREEWQVVSAFASDLAEYMKNHEASEAGGET